jgi:ribosome-associated protein
MLEINEQLAIPDEELTFTFARSGGPGGQNVNKVSSKAVLRWDLAANSSLPEEAKARLRGQERRRITTEGQLVITSQTYRDQERNKQECLDRLVGMVRRALVAPKPRKVTRPTRGSKQRRLAEKRRRAEAKAARRAVGEE